jgi:hypothetical protein
LSTRRIAAPAANWLTDRNNSIWDSLGHILMVNQLGACTLRSMLAKTRRCRGWRQKVDRNRGSKVIGDHFENLFSIYRREFLKMIGDHFSVITCCICRQLVDRSTLGQFNLGQLPMEQPTLVHWEKLISDRLSGSLKRLRERLVAALKSIGTGGQK